MTQAVPSVMRTVVDQSDRVLRTYAVDPGLVAEHANGERRITKGGYGDRQLFELVQNAADEIRGKSSGLVQVVLTETHLYCANEGDPVTAEGAETILRMSMSKKRGGQIGRFGVGVKSVLVVTDAPEFFSRTGSFGFDRSWSYEQIKAVPGVTDRYGPDFDAPVLRTARPLDQEAERAADAVLHELLNWATTVVRLPLLRGADGRLAKDMHGGGTGGREEFPAGFQLFSPHVAKVVLEDRRPRPVARRVLSAQQVGHVHSVREERTGRAAASEDWQVFSVTHEPGPAARADAGELHDRLTVDVSWAVPAMEKDMTSGLYTSQRARGRGRFWSFFPTKYEMSLSGILNGAWKTNEDRQNLLDSSPFNQEMIRVAARLVVDSLPQVAPAEDPAAYLRLLPGRSKEAISWADDLLLREIWSHTAERPSLPDQEGVLRVPSAIRLNPRFEEHKNNRKLVSDWLRMWHECPGRPSNWLHPNADVEVLRTGKVEHIREAAKVERAGVREWLEALANCATAEASATAIRILASMIKVNSPYADEARKARIVLTEKHGLVAPKPGEVFRRAEHGGLPESLVYVADALAEDQTLEAALTLVGIREAHAEGRFVSVLDQGFDGYGDSEWQRFWELFRQAGQGRLTQEVLRRVPTPRDTLRVRTADEQWRPVKDCMLPGPVVSGDRDPSIAVDMGFHSDDAPFFPEVGLRERPVTGLRPVQGEAWFDEYREALHAAYLRKLDSQAPRPGLQTMKAEGSPIGGPLPLFRALSDESRAAFLAALPDGAVVEHWTRHYGTRVNTRQSVVSPIRWMLRKYGTVATSQGIKPLREAVGPQLAAYRDVLPVADRLSPEKARKLGLATTVDDVPGDRWEALLTEVSRSEDDTFVGATYVMLTRFDADFPEGSLTRCRIGHSWGTRPDDEITIAVGDAEYRALRAEQLPALLVSSPADAALMVEKWGMLRFADVVSKETREVFDGEPVPLLDLYPSLRQRLDSSNRNTMVQRCSELEVVTRTPNGAKPDSLDAVRQGSTIKVRVPVDREPMLRLIDRELTLRLGAAGCRAVLEQQERIERDTALQNAIREVRESEDVVTKIELLIGAEALRAGLPEGLVDAEMQATDGAEPSGHRIAQMAFNAHGDGVLHQHHREISARFPNAPVGYTGSSNAVAFVSDLRLPASFAGSRTPPPPASESVDGPKDFPHLHAYQEDLVRNISTMLDRLAPQRGMLSLPTGAGKTRVTSEAVIRWIKRVGDLRGPILWIAQTEELCEQAVQSWKFVWGKVGAERPLAISRLWGSNEVGEAVGGPHLVVAIDAKLERCLATDQYTWLRNAALVVVDEAHTAVSKRYTGILGNLGLTQYETNRHLLGLTATPFRNTNEEETRRLVSRFGNRLDEGVFPSADPYRDLQAWGMLAQVEHRTLEGGRIELTRDEKAYSERMAVLSRAAEQRLGEDHARSRRIVDAIAGLPDDWPTLVFATSVDHAKYLAAMLNDVGISSAAVDSTTSMENRRRRIAEFRSGDLRVLANYGVLSQGFDAPATRAVVVARPVYSTNVYQQMIGRGLRGPLNGGKDTCLILNVSDNIDNFDTKLAFNQFEHLWSRK